MEWTELKVHEFVKKVVVSTMSRMLFDSFMCPDTSFINSGLFLLCMFAIAPPNNMALIKSSLSVSHDAMFVAHFVAAAFGMVAECTTLLCNKLHNKSLVYHQPSFVTVQLHLQSRCNK